MQGKLRWGDFVICAVVLVLAGLITLPFLFQPSDSLTCEIKQGDTVVKTIRLADGYQDTITLTAGDITNVIEVDGKSVVQLSRSGVRPHRNAHPCRSDGGLSAYSRGCASDWRRYDRRRGGKMRGGQG